eukprot:6761071-Prymnesium_polylepis.1
MAITREVAKSWPICVLPSRYIPHAICGQVVAETRGGISGQVVGGGVQSDVHGPQQTERTAHALPPFSCAGERGEARLLQRASIPSPASGRREEMREGLLRAGGRLYQCPRPGR